MSLDQENRILAIETPLGPNVLALRSMVLTEQLGRLFQIDAELSSEEDDVDFDAVIGHPTTIRLKLTPPAKRYFHGHISRFIQVAEQEGLAHYRATIVPWVWFLTRNSDCRIFQEKSVPEILEDVFQRHGFSDYQINLSGTYAAKEFCVQYRETDFNFVSRLMEQEGIYYFFKHEQGKHTLMLADALSAHNPFEGYDEITFQELQAEAAEREVITDWTVEKEVQPVAYALNDFDFKRPKASLRAAANVSRSHGKAEFEIYDYPGEYLEQSDGERLSDVRLHELQVQHKILHGQANVRGLSAGSLFTLRGHPRSNQNREYLITGVSLHADAGEFAARGGGGASAGGFLSCRFTCIESDQPFRPQRTTPKPLVQGPQTAIVVGPAGDEIHTDEHARVKLHFHWDRHDNQDENSSCWIRVSHANAGKGWGSMITPRIGHEVIVEFLEGDPDRPIITGRVYNGDNAPPYAGGQGVVSGLKSQTHKGSGSNEMSMDDTAGKEKITIHAQYDQSTTVGHDQANSIGNNRSTNVTVDDDETVGGKQTVKVTGHRKLTVDGGQDITITGAQDETVTGHQKTDIGAGQEVKVTGDDTTNVTAHQAVTVGGGQDVTVTGDQKLESSAKQTLKAGAGQDLDVTGKQSVHATGEIEITSDAKIKLSAGGSTIEIGPSGITIEAAAKVAVKGAVINLN